jgi:hypothetical protein
LSLIQTYDGMVPFDLGAVLSGESEDAQLLRSCSSSWSALAYREGDGCWLIAWNPWHAPTRVRASLMEEVAHIVLEHRPTKLVPDPITGLPRRTFSRSKEQEAYGVGAASLVPYNGLVILSRLGRSEADIARQFGVSEELVAFRMKVTGARKAA